MTTTSPRYTRPALGALTLVALALTGCSASLASQEPTTPAPSTSTAADPTPTPTPEPTDEESGSDSTLATVPGYDVGEFPPVPLFVLPDLGLLDASLAGFTPELTELVGTYPGLTISPARCDESGTLQAGNGSLLLYGDGSGVYSGPDGGTVNYGDGSGTYSIGGVDVVVYGDGSGTYEGNGLSIVNYGDGSGRYVDDTVGLTVVVYGDGSGTWSQDDVTITNYGDGSGTYTSAGETIVNYGDGSGSYEGNGLSIVNYGDRTGTVDGTWIEPEPIDAVPAIGSFPPMGALEPITSCGTTITLDSAVLFDIDLWDIRPEAAAVLDSLAQALTDGAVPAAQVAGHTDSVRDEAWNQTLSENRAAAVTQALLDRGVSADLTATGFGESQPVASNDTAAGRQQNRRVEIFIPAF